MEQYQCVDILLVEDSPLDAELTIAALQAARLGNTITWVRDGADALDFLFRRGAHEDREGGNPKLVLLDLKMPRIDGLEVLAAIRDAAETRSVAVVVMTSSAEDEDVRRAYELGVNSYVVKPIAFDALADVARQAGYYWLAVNRVPA